MPTTTRTSHSGLTRLALASVIMTAAAAGVSPLPSQTVQRVTNSGDDRPLDWGVRERFRIGPAMDGPGAFFRVYPWTIATGPGGRIVVLDVGYYRVSVFDADGHHVRNLGREGGGPGELVRPVGVAVGDEGIISVADEGKLGTVRFDSAGRVLEQRRVSVRVGPIGVLPQGLIVGQWNGAAETVRLILIAEDDTTVLADAPQPGIVQFRDCPVGVPGRPFFAQTVRWASGHDLVVLNDTAAYELSVYSGDAEVMRINRDVPAIEIDRNAALASNAVRGGFEITFGSKKCVISPEDLLEGRGYARTTSPIADLAIEPDGRIWVNRVRELNGPATIDVFDSVGHYLGSLPEGSPFPTAFQSADHFVVLRWDPDGVPYVVSYEVVRDPR